MKPAPFQYLKARSLEEALAAKAALGDDARFLAGGQSLIPTMNFRMAQPTALVDLNGLTGLAGIAEQPDGTIGIGALARHRDVERSAVIARWQPMLVEAVREVAHPQIRARGTLCGNLAHADPMSELPAVMLALGARLTAQSVSGQRMIAAQDFFRGVFTTALSAEEMLVHVAVPPLQAGTGTCFLELARRKGDYAMAGVAAVVTLDDRRLCRSARLAYCAAGETPVLAEPAAGLLVGAVIDADSAAAVGTAAAEVLAPTGDVQAGADYKRHLAAVLTKRALLAAADRARGA